MPLLLGLAAAPALATETIHHLTPPRPRPFRPKAKGEAAPGEGPVAATEILQFGTNEVQPVVRQYMQYKYGWGKAAP